MKKILFSIPFLFFALKSFSQSESRGWKGLWGFGVSRSTFKVSDIDLNNNLIGGNAFFELPATSNFTTRLEFNYLQRTGDTLPRSSNINYYWNIKAGIGTIARSGKRLQFPFLAGFSYNDTGGTWSFPSWGLWAKGGFRFFLTKKISLYADAGIDGMYAPEINVKYSSGKTETLNMTPYNTNICLGLIFSNF